MKYASLKLIGRCGSNFTRVFFKLISQIYILRTCLKICLRWVSQNPIDFFFYNQSTLVQVILMPWWCQATSHYLSQRWPQSMPPYGITKPQWVINVWTLCTYNWLSDITQLTHWGGNKMATTLQTTFLNVFSWMKIYKFCLGFHWSLFPRVKSTIFQQWFR